MILFQLICFSLLIFAYAVVWQMDRQNVSLSVLIFFTSWIGEATSIYFYGFYAYADTWWFKLVGVPLLIPLIWPMVIITGRSVILSLWPNAKRSLPFLVGVIVFFDASMVEIAAVNSDLWVWKETGYHGVPLMGVLGWAYFAAFVTYLLQILEARQRLWVLVAAPAMLHLTILLCWWGLFKWVLRGDWFLLYGAGILVATAAILKIRNWRRMPMKIAGIRILAASVFVGLVLLTAPTDLRVWLHIVLLAVPYLLATEFHR